MVTLKYWSFLYQSCLSINSSITVHYKYSHSIAVGLQVQESMVRPIFLAVHDIAKPESRASRDYSRSMARVTSASAR